MSFVLVVLLWLAAVVFGSSSKALAEDREAVFMYGPPSPFGCLYSKTTQIPE